MIEIVGTIFAVLCGAMLLFIIVVVVACAFEKDDYEYRN